MAVDTALSKQQADSDGVEATYTELDASNTFGWKNSGQEILHVVNGAGSEIVVTIATTKTVDGEAVADKTYTIPDAEERFIAGLAPDVYNDGDGYTNITCDEASGVEVAVIQSSR